MTMHFFAIPALDAAAAQAALQRFCASERVVAVERQFVADGARSFWAVCVTVVAGQAPLPAELRAGARGSPRVDYRAVLDEATFRLFAELRNWRRQAAETAGVPIYAVFTNEQLAQIARVKPRSRADLAAIDGVGGARVERHGDAVLACVQGATPGAVD